LGRGEEEGECDALLFCFHFQIDMLESAVWKNVIVLQTVLEEVRKRSTTNYKKLKELMADRPDDFYVFVNEHHKYKKKQNTLETGTKS